MAKDKRSRGKRSDGRLEKKITINGKHYHIYGKTVKELLEKEAAKLEEIEHGRVNHNNPTIREYIDLWLENIKDSISSITYFNYDRQYNTICDTEICSGKRFGDMRIRDVNINDLRALQAAINKDRKTTTTNFLMGMTKRIFKEAINERLIDYNPCGLLKSIKKTEEDARDTIHRALTLEETATFFNCETTRNSLYYNVFRLAINTGMRFGEIGALKTTDIYNNEIHVERTLTQTETGQVKIGDSAKTQAGKRIIPINDNIQKILDDQRKLNAMIDSNIIDINDPLTGLLFKTESRKLLSNDRVNHEISIICKETGIEHFSMHAFRDTFATRAIESGVEPKTLQEILGHKDISITLNLYAHVMNDTKHEAMKKIIIAI